MQHRDKKIIIQKIISEINVGIQLLGDITLEVDMSIQKKTCTGMTRFGKGRGW